MEKIKSEFDRMAINILSQIVPDQKMRLEAGEGQVWVSECKDVQGDMSVTTIKKDDKIIARIVYDYETGEEKTFTQGGRK